MRAIVLKEFGPAENLRWETVPMPQPRAGEVLLRVGAVSVDLFQMEFRSGRALQVELPRIMGNGPLSRVRCRSRAQSSHVARRHCGQLPLARRRLCRFPESGPNDDLIERRGELPFRIFLDQP